MYQFSWRKKPTDNTEKLDEWEKKKGREYFAEYYEKNRTEILRKDRKRHKETYKLDKERIDAKQKERDKKRDRSAYNKEYYAKHKKKMQNKNKAQYEKHKEKRKEEALKYYYAHKEEIALKRKRKRLYDKNREDKSITREHQELELGCISAVQD